MNADLLFNIMLNSFIAGFFAGVIWGMAKKIV